jgi:hypothetical protein
MLGGMVGEIYVLSLPRADDDGKKRPHKENERDSATKA